MAYSVTDTKEVSTITPAGAQRKVYRVWIRTGHLATGMVEVEKDDWTAEKLPFILEAKATELDLAFALGGRGRG